MYWIYVWCQVLSSTWTSLVAQTVKNLPAMQESQVWFQGWEDPQERGMATHSSILAWRIPWTEEPGVQSTGSQNVRHNWVTKYTHTHTHTHARTYTELNFINEFSFNLYINSRKLLSLYLFVDEKTYLDQRK